MSQVKSTPDEHRMSPEEFKQKLIDYQKSRPVVMTEEEFSSELDETVVLRYQRGLDLLDEVVAEIQLAARTRAPNLDAEKMAKKVEDATVAFSYGHVGHNRCGMAHKGAHARVILWYDDKASGEG